MRLFNVEVKVRTSEDEDTTPSMTEAEVRRIMQAAHEHPEYRKGTISYDRAFNALITEAFDLKAQDHE